MNLVIDEGNTAVKVAVFQNQEKIFFQVFSKNNFQKEILQVVDFDEVDFCIVASVVKSVEERFSFLKEKIKSVLFVNSQTPMPFINKYATPNTLGIDRLALMGGAVSLYPNQNVLVIDAGTCITFDIMTAKGEYLGGAIAPGIAMRLKAMHEFTSKLPLIPEQKNFNIENFIGNSTESCILSGVYHNVVREIEGVITQYEEKFKDLTTILTGGNHIYLVNNIKNCIFANSFFLLEGLNAILEWQKRDR
ncbi:type III pantothenate kinase [Capnocytophaga felis]|uniref:Type III pantothenate kinase n=1 Tax=Capnocytophaga felis TaxID=2267611 RepID=A0A5M4B9M2_9FLAO|nr:type III pantothenate kinase [Capnocytophaga felis]GET46100.1 type III pantothenate kinase [Capnocytophaga felis]GET48892.1 type III pantothenate kinase [Capnocytophaga felis]